MSSAVFSRRVRGAAAVAACCKARTQRPRIRNCGTNLIVCESAKATEGILGPSNASISSLSRQASKVKNHVTIAASMPPALTPKSSASP